MNKYARWLALKLINRRLRKIEYRALKNMRKAAVRNTARIVDYVDDPQEYRKLLALRLNIEGINGPWGGTFAFMPWSVRPKHDKHVEKFVPQKVTYVEPKPLSEEDQRWADMSAEEFIEALEEISE